MVNEDGTSKMMTWQVPAHTPPWKKDFASIYIELLGSQIRYVQGKKYRTRVIEAGEGEPLILIHGVGGSAEAWFRNVMPLAEHFHVCAIDALFHGFSSKESDIEDQTEAQVDHVIDFMDAMGFDTAHVYGESMGAHITFRLALEHPERLKRIILSTGHQMKWKRSDFAPWQKGADSLRLLTQAAAEHPDRRSIQLRMEWLMATPDRVVDELVDLRLKMYQMPEARPAMNRTGLLGGRPVKLFEEEDCQRIKAETLVYWTEFNPSNGADQGEYWASLIPGAKFFLQRNAGHWPQYELPEEHNEVVISFMKTGELPA
jgi:pimeloyl-ACP methyl ester carboxylesterase